MRWAKRVAVVLVAALVVVAGYQFLKRYLTAQRPIYRVGSRDREEATGAFRELFHRAGLSEAVLPPEVRGKRKDKSFLDRIRFVRCEDAMSRQHGWFRLVQVCYNTVAEDESGDRIHSFVFNRRGQCVFHSRDGLFGHGFGDFTGDGEVEKVVVVRSKDSTIWPDFETFRVHRITFSGDRLLLAVTYRRWGTMLGKNGPSDFCFSVSAYPRSYSPWGIELLDSQGKAQAVKFAWPSEKQTFVPTAPPSKDWWVLFPLEAKPRSSLP